MKEIGFHANYLKSLRKKNHFLKFPQSVAKLFVIHGKRYAKLPIPFAQSESSPMSNLRGFLAAGLLLDAPLVLPLGGNFVRPLGFCFLACPPADSVLIRGRFPGSKARV